jgi:NTE family protein
MAEHGFALVLSGGGVTGVAWETGLLKGLRDAGLDLTRADLIVGTSAGSIVGTQIAAGLDLDAMYARQLEPPDPRFEYAPKVDFFQEFARIGPELMAAASAQTADEPGMPQSARAMIGRRAREAQTAPEADRLEIVARRLTVTDWPRRQLVVTAVDVDDGSFVTWNRDSGVQLTSAVASSCAVPFVWPPVTINGHHYMDGGVRSGTNADLAVGYERVVVLTPMGSISPLGASLVKEQRVLEQSGASVLIVEADAAGKAAFGPNPLDPSRRGAAAEAGLRQAATAAERVAEAVRAT